MADAGDGGDGGASVVPKPIEEPFVDPYPRNYADPTLTKRVVEGELALVGSGMSACTNQLPAPGDRWCAFSRATDDGATELWVVNVSQARENAPVACDGSEQECLRLTSQLWTGSQLYGPMHPYTHRFEGDTLIFHADAPSELREPYEGPIYAWRPGWEAARQVSELGVACTGHRLSAAIYCIDAADVDVAPLDEFLPPIWHSFDLLAGMLDVEADGPLSLVERIAVHDADLDSFRMRFTRSGNRLVYSSVPEGAERQTLRWLALDSPSPFEPGTVLEDAAQWELAHDDAAAYVLRGYSRESGVGTLALVDFPAAETVQQVASYVFHIDPVGALDDLLSTEDRGFGYDRSSPDGEVFEFIADRTKLDEVQTVAVDTAGLRVSADARYTLFFQKNDNGWPVATVGRNDGSGSCALNNDLLAETYSGKFSADGQRALWIEYGQSGSEEGWAADPSTCGEKAKFGDWVLGYTISGDFLVFEGGDAEDSTSYLNYTRLPRAATSPPVIPLIIVEGPKYPFVTLPDGDATYVVYTAPNDESDSQGLFVHGPLEEGLPAE